MSRFSIPEANSRDNELVGRFVEGDEEALRAVLCRFGPQVRAAISRRYSGMLDVDEIAEVVLMGTFRAWRAREQFDPARGSLLQWLRAIAHNEARSCLRQDWRQARLNERLLPPEQLDAAVTSRPAQQDLIGAAAASSGPLAALHLGLARLSAKERTVLMETVGNDRPVRDLAETLGVTTSTVRTLRSRALRKLKAFTGGHGGDP